jgi:phenylalanyl-tRNA synthetase beta chain
VLIDGVEVGYLGQIHPSIIDKLGVDKPVYGGELYYSELSKCFNDKIIYKTISKFPSIERDIALLLDSSVSCESVMSLIKENAGKYLESLSLFDIYQGEQVGAGKKSMAFNLVFVADDRTLNVDEVDNIIKTILSALESKLGAQLR